MQNTVRTTIRIRKDLLDQSRSLAFKRGSSLQDVINETLAKGFKLISDFDSHQQAMKTIDQIRESMKNKDINLTELLELDKKQKR